MSKSEKCKIHFVLNEPYPYGMACTNRIHLYARGLLNQGYEVKIYIPLPLDHQTQVINTSRKGSYEGVDYVYAWFSPIRSRYFLLRRIHDLLSPLFAGFLSYRERPDLIFMVSNSVLHILINKFITTILGIGYFQEKSELPFFQRERLSFSQKVYVKFIYRLFDGIVVISDPLFEYFKMKIKRGTQLLKIPILVDVNEVYCAEVLREKTIVYTGPLTQHKDGILTIMESFFRITEKFPDYTLELTGDLSSSPDRLDIQKIIEGSEFHARVKFLGFVDRQELKKVLNRASVLVLAKPVSRQASACFPTKLGEYLATGNPVLTTNVGGIPNYLEDGVNAFLSEPTVNSFADCLQTILTDLKCARLVGMRGQELARREFDCFAQTKHLSDFLKQECMMKP